MQQGNVKLTITYEDGSVRTTNVSDDILKTEVITSKRRGKTIETKVSPFEKVNTLAQDTGLVKSFKLERGREVILSKGITKPYTLEKPQKRDFIEKKREEQKLDVRALKKQPFTKAYKTLEELETIK